MTEEKDYASMTLESLVQEQKAIKKQEIFTSIAIGFLIGVMAYGIGRNGLGFLYIFIPTLFIYASYKYIQKLHRHLRTIESEIEAKKRH